MARDKGTFDFSANFEVKKKGTIDARQLVDTFSDLLNFTESNFIPKGFPVSVSNTSTFNGTEYTNGIYECIDADNLNLEVSWKKANDLNGLDSTDFVRSTGDVNETVTGIKTFSSSPIIPAPTTDLQAATKKYVDDNGAISVDSVANVATNTILGRISAGSGDSEELTPGQLRTLINVEDDSDKTDTTNVTAAGALMDSELTSIVDVKAIDQSLISGAAPVFDASNMTNLPEESVDVVSNVATARILGRTTAGSGDSEELTASEVRTLINVEDGATADQDLSGKQNILAEGAFVDGDKTKLDTYSEANQTANNAKVTYPSADSTKVGHISVTQAVNLDTMESDIANKANTADLATVATSGDYDDLSNKPDLSAFDNISEHANEAAFPGTGAADKFYLAQDTGILYRWTGSAYAIISAQ